MLYSGAMHLHAVTVAHALESHLLLRCIYLLRIWLMIEQ